MKKIGTLENIYNIYWKAKGKFKVECMVQGHTISLVNFEFYPRLSEETNCFVADLVLNGIVVGDCSNEGRGGCANYHTFNNREVARVVEKALAETEKYCFPKYKENLADVIDYLAYLVICLGEQTSATKAKQLIAELAEMSEKYRAKYGNL